MSGHDYRKCYSVLGVFPDDDWETIRAAYKRQILRWHPDKFQDPEKKNIAEQKSRELNQAYQLLDEYYRKNGSLPHDINTEPAAEYPSSGARPDVQHAATASSNQPWHSAATAESDDNSASLSGGRKRAFIILFLAILASYWLYEAEFEAVLHTPQGEPLTGAHPPTTVSNANSITDAYNNGPNSSDSDTSAEGTNPILAGPGVARQIRIGTTQKEVLKIQGTPTRQTDNSWEYGLSRIDFQNGRVVGWYESPMNPLRIRQ